VVMLLAGSRGVLVGTSGYRLRLELFPVEDAKCRAAKSGSFMKRVWQRSRDGFFVTLGEGSRRSFDRPPRTRGLAEGAGYAYLSAGRMEGREYRRVVLPYGTAVAYIGRGGRRRVSGRRLSGLPAGEGVRSSDIVDRRRAGGRT
jgi:hypothetical protein